MPTWTSMLGGKFPREEIDRLEREHYETLHRLLKEPANSHCADCGQAGGTSWASVTLGVFLCTRCADVHRAMGTHMSKVKGCCGTDLWGPDEISRMLAAGNAAAEDMYGGDKPAADATKEFRVEFCKAKYSTSRLDRHASKCPTRKASLPNCPSAVDAKLAAVDSGSAAPAVGKSRRVAPAHLDDHHDPCDDLLKALGETTQALTPVDVLKSSEWFSGPRVERQHSTGSTAASDGEARSLLKSTSGSMPRSAAAPSKSATTVPPDGVWDDFGNW